jgi:acyl transferase domain-containing protein
LNPVAIIGMGCRFPGGADNPEKFWQLLCEGFDALTDVPPERWNSRKFYDPAPESPGKTYLHKGHFIHQPIDRFDAAFFGISPREAVFVDPMQRVLLEVAWEALEDAGLAPGRLSETPTGVFVGAFALDSLVGQINPYNRPNADSHAATGATSAILANRLSYVFGFRGPSVALDTACSSSLVALHLACQSLESGECTLAIAGGANVMSRPEYPILMSKARFLAPDGRCKTFDASADGYGRGEGVGVVVLKPLAKAIEDGDPIHAVIRATGVNQDGHTSGLSVPNGAAQETLLRHAYNAADVKVEEVGYLEAHGTGTAVGDPIETSAIGNVMCGSRTPEQALWISSVKPNIGHLEAAAGVAGLIKAALCLKHKQIPPTRGIKTLNPRIPFDKLRLRVPTSLQPWPESDKPAIAGVNSFGYGGTNAHAVLQEAPAPAQEKVEANDTQATPYVLPLSTRGMDAMKALAGEYVKLLESPQSEGYFRDLCYSAGRRDNRLDQRLAIVASSKDELLGHLQGFVAGTPSTSLFQGTGSSRPPRPIFVFTGMGPQWWAMGRGLYENEPIFHAAVDRIDERFRQLTPNCSPLRELLASETDSRMASTEVAQTTTFVLQTALIELLAHWGIAPAAVVGHSVGEVAAAHAAGALTLDDGVRLSYHRSRLQARAAGKGRMLAVGLSEEEALAKLQGSEGLVEVAAVNGPKSITLAGDGSTLERLAQTLTLEGVFHRFLVVEVAYHSRDMEPIRDDLLAALADLRPVTAKLPFYSTVTGKLANGSELDAEYWYRNVRNAVRFADAIDRIVTDGYDLFVEVGPHPALSTSVTQCLRRRSAQAAIIPTLHRNKNDVIAVRETLAQLFTVGYPVEWAKLYPTAGRRVKLPAYPWQREYHWRETDESREDRLGGARHPLLGLTVKAPLPTRESELATALFPYLPDHRIQGRIVFPGAGYVETALAIGCEASGNDNCVLEDVEFHKVLMIDPTREYPCLRSAYDAAQAQVQIFSRAGSQDWTLHATGRYLATKPDANVKPLPIDEVRRRIDEALEPAEVYVSLRKMGLEYGPAFQCMRQLWRKGNEVLVRVALPEGATSDEYLVHPSLLDAAFQSLAVVVSDNENGSHNGLCLPVGIDRFRLHSRVGSAAWVVGKLTRFNSRSVEGDLQFADDGGKTLAEVRGVRFQFLPSAESSSTASLLYSFSWRRAETQPKVEANSNGHANGHTNGHANGHTNGNGHANGNGHVLHPTTQGSCLVLGGRGKLANDLADALAHRGGYVTRIDRPAVDTALAAGKRDALTEVLKTQPWPERVVCLWGLDVPDAGEPLPAPGTEILTLFQSLAGAARGPAPRLWIVTSGAQEVETESPATPTAAMLWGLGRVLAAEHGDLRCTLVDLDPTGNIDAASLAEEIIADSPEPEVAFRGGIRFVRRAERVTHLPDVVVPTTTEEDPSVRLQVGKRGGIESLSFRRSPAREPGANEVTVRVRAAGLNFKDVLKAMGILSERIVNGTMSGDALGLECAGTIVAVGPGVERFKVGDDVMACAADCFRTHLTVPTDMVFPKLPSMRFADEAALPVVFLTAHYSLITMAYLERGERVLIHAATGGVGLAAIQVARRAGAIIFATAGSPEKRELLKQMGVEHIMDSRSLDFADQIMEKTGGRGVDVVLNSLTGQALAKSVEILAPFGRFVEIGKRDIDENNGLRMRPFNRNLSFISIDVDRLIVERPKQTKNLMEEIRELFRTGAYTPLPVQLFPAAQVKDAFRHLGQAKHIGKVVLSLEEAGAAVGAGDEEPSFRADATYLVTGGLGGVGLRLAEWLADHGARNLLLVGRRGAATPEAKRVLACLKKRGASVKAVAGDVSKRADVDSLIASVPGSAPLRGIFHAAMVLDDGLAMQLDGERFNKVLAPKAFGAWHLHNATIDVPLEHFVLFSSVVAELGNAGQAAYAAANAFLDALARLRRGRGLPGLSINWGAFGDAGVLARNDQLAAHLARQGWNGISTSRAFDALATVLSRPIAQVTVADVDWQTWSKAVPSLAQSPRFADLVAASAISDGSSDAEWRASLMRMEPEQRLGAVQQAVCEGVAQVLGLDPAKLDCQRRLDQLGLASLMAVEVQHVLRQRTGLEVTAMDMMQGPTVHELSKVLLARLFPPSEANGASGESAAAPAKAGPVEASAS